jgi:hypothetical protein
MPRPVAYRSSKRARARLASGKASAARSARTYRASRRNRAKQVRRDNKLTALTVGGVMEPAPLKTNGEASMIPRRLFHRVSKKTYPKTNIPGSMRRRIDRGEFMTAR